MNPAQNWAYSNTCSTRVKFISHLPPSSSIHRLMALGSIYLTGIFPSLEYGWLWIFPLFFISPNWTAFTLWTLRYECASSWVQSRKVFRVLNGLCWRMGVWNWSCSIASAAEWGRAHVWVMRWPKKIKKVQCRQQQQQVEWSTGRQNELSASAAFNNWGSLDNLILCFLLRLRHFFHHNSIYIYHHPYNLWVDAVCGLQFFFECLKCEYELHKSSRGNCLLSTLLYYIAHSLAHWLESWLLGSFTGIYSPGHKDSMNIFVLIFKGLKWTTCQS